MKALIDYLGTLTITQGRRADEPFEVLPWQSRFVRGAFKRNVDTAALSVGRGNGKTTLVAGLACAALDGPLAVNRGEVVLVASSFDQARISFEHIRAFMRDKLDNRDRWRVWDTAQQARIEDRKTGARVRCIGSDPRRAHGLAPVLILADEPAQWPGNQGDGMVAALRTAAGKQPRCLFVALGTRPADSDHWFQAMLDGGADYSQTHAAKPSDPLFQRRTWKRANPSLDAMPDLARVLKRESEEAKRDPSMLAMFKALRLNLGLAETVENILLEPSIWEAIEGDAPADGDYVLGLDLGTNSAMSAASAYHPMTSRLDAFAVYPEHPSLGLRGLADGVGNRYVRMHERNELIVRGERVSDIGGLLTEVRNRWGNPALILCDRWREAELRQSLEKVGFPLTNLQLRGQGFRDGAEDVRRFRRACLDGRVIPVQSLLLRSALAESRLVIDTAGNAKLAKNAQGGRRHRAKDDAIAAAILAISAGERLYKGPRNVQDGAQSVVSGVS